MSEAHNKASESGVMIANVIKCEGMNLVVRDAVSGAEVTVTDQTPFADYSGNRYFFSNADGKMKFQANPSSYAGSVGDVKKSS